MRGLLLLLTLLSALTFFGQNTKDVLLKDLVKIENSKFTINDFTLLKNDYRTQQVKAYAEAQSENLISRDYFILIFSQITGEYINKLADEGSYKTENLAEMIGKPDVEINIYMANSGIQIEIINYIKTERHTLKWDDFLE